MMLHDINICTININFLEFFCLGQYGHTNIRFNWSFSVSKVKSKSFGVVIFFWIFFSELDILIGFLRSSSLVLGLDS